MRFTWKWYVGTEAAAFRDTLHGPFVTGFISCQIAGSMVACTFLSAPLMFLAAKMIALRDLNPEDYIQHFDNFLLNVSIAGLIGAVSETFHSSTKVTKREL